MENRNTIVSTIEGGAKELTRPHDRPAPQYVRWPFITIEGMIDLQARTRLTIFDAVNEYFITGKAIIPAEAAESAMPMVRMAINATEEDLDRQTRRSENNAKAANSRWGNSGDELEPIEYPLIAVPLKMKGWKLTRGKVDIPIDEVLEYAAIFFLRGYPTDEVPNFISHWAKKNWNDGAIAGREGRINRAQRWRLLNGRSSRFESDEAALAFFTSFLLALPEDKRVYLLSDKVSIAVSKDKKVTLAIPAEIVDFLSQSSMVKGALSEYHQAHGLKPGRCSLVTIPFTLLIK